MKVKVLRQQFPGAEAYWERFDADVPGDMSVAGLLDHLNYRDDIVDENGRPTTRIGWECSCLQGICGSCAMVINGVPALACETFVRDLEGDEIEIRPLRKFPVIHDLLTDRSVIQENLRQMNMYIGEYQPAGADHAAGAQRQNTSAGTQSPVLSAGKGPAVAQAQKLSAREEKRREEEHLHQYMAAKCLKCGLCLEVCPNYVNGKTFFGAVFANDCYLVAARNHEKAGEIRRQYAEHFGSACSKSLSCMDICPMHIPTLASMAKLNRQNGGPPRKPEFFDGSGDCLRTVKTSRPYGGSGSGSS